jgi:group I intron endonuclease
MEREVISGIYKIENLLDGKKYVGLSTNIYRRWTDHRRMLMGGYHDNKHLQGAWKKYGEENFVFTILEECEDSQLSDREIYYIKLLQCNNSKFGYNFSTGGDRPVFNKDVLIEKALKYSKRILQFDQDGNFIKEYVSAIYVAKEFGVQDSLIYQCCLGQVYLGLGYQWRFKKEFDSQLSNGVNVEDLKIAPFIRDYHAEKICQFDTNGTLIKVWNSCSQIGEELNVAYENIRACCDKQYGRKTYIGYIWLYKSDYEESGLDLEYHKPKRNNKAVAQHDMKMNYISTFVSAREAMAETGANYKHISAVCLGKRKSAGGYIWKFITED